MKLFSAMVIYFIECLMAYWKTLSPPSPQVDRRYRRNAAKSRLKSRSFIKGSWTPYETI